MKHSTAPKRMFNILLGILLIGGVVVAVKLFRAKVNPASTLNYVLNDHDGDIFA